MATLKVSLNRSVNTLNVNNSISKDSMNLCR